MDPVMQQFLAAQMQLFQDMSNRMATMEDQMNQNQPLRDNYRKFLKRDPQHSLTLLIHLRLMIG
jgi:hypothetical protein